MKKKRLSKKADKIIGAITKSMKKDVEINYICGWGNRPFEDDDNRRGFIVGWSAKNFGFGEITFAVRDGKIVCDNECMSKQFVKNVLCALVDDCEFLNGGPDGTER